MADPRPAPEPATRALRTLERLADSRWFAYGSIFLIQLKLIWGIWRYEDIAGGDTASYFSLASNWAESLDLSLAWSPLYLVYYGSLQSLIPDAYDVTIAHRVIIVLAASLLVLAVLRRLLPHGIAWPLALWWTVLPINYDTLYEVHLFALLPGLAAVLMAASRRGLMMRATVFGILLTIAVLVRIETAIAALVWAVAWIAYEVWQRRQGLIAEPARRLTIAFAAPIAVAVALGSVVVLSSDYSASEELEAKHRLNVCQVFAFGYQQREGEEAFPESPFTECGALAQREFGFERPSLTEAVRENTGAMADHALWNAHLVPQGLELMLFNAISGSGRVNPDYGRVTTGSTRAALGLIAVMIVLAAGMVLLWRERERWWREWIRDRAWAWLALGSLAAVTPLVILTQRPRPSYLFALTVLILALIGMSALVIGSRWPRLSRLRAALPLVAAMVLVIMPSHYREGEPTRDQRPLLTAISRLEPLEKELGDRRALLAARFAAQICAYAGPPQSCTGISLEEALNDVPPGTPPGDLVDRLGIDLVYADQALASSPEGNPLASELEGNGWERLAPPGAAEKWALLGRIGPTPRPATPEEPLFPPYGRSDP